MSTYTLIGMLWHDRRNGNTYHSARAFKDGELVAVVPFQYGYGDQWDYTIAEALEAAGTIPAGNYYGAGRALREGGHDVVTFCANGTRREVRDFGTDPRETEGTR